MNKIPRTASCSVICTSMSVFVSLRTRLRSRKAISEEAGVLREWLNPPGAAEVMNPGERELFARLQQLVAGLPVLLAPKMRILDALELGALPGVSSTGRDYAFRGHFDVVLVDLRTYLPAPAR